MTNLLVFKHGVLDYFCFCYVFIIIYLPNFLRSSTTIYQINASTDISEVWHPWLEYSLSWLEIIPIAYLIFRRRFSSAVNCYPLIVVPFIANILRYFLGDTNVFSYGKCGDYSVFLSLSVGFGCYLLLVDKHFPTNRLLKWIVSLNFVTQIIFILTERETAGMGRYGALGSPVGDLGFICYTYCLYFLFVEKDRKLPIFALSVISLIISGSRINLILCLLMCAIFARKLQTIQLWVKKRLASITFLVGGLLVCALYGLLDEDFSKSLVMNRGLMRLGDFFEAITHFDITWFSQDESSTGRWQSIGAALHLISENFFGISASLIDIQIQLINLDVVWHAPFPHSTLLCNYLLYGPIVLVYTYYLCKMLFKFYKAGDSAYVLVLGCLISFFVWGGAMMNTKTIVWICLLFHSLQQHYISQGCYKYKVRSI